jgi:hypothetical protein
MYIPDDPNLKGIDVVDRRARARTKCASGKTPRPRVFRCYYSQDVPKFLGLCRERDAYVLVVIAAPFWNSWGTVVGEEFIIVYEHHEEIGMEALC